MRLTQRNMTYIPTSIQRGPPRDRPPPDKDHAAAGSFTIAYFHGRGSCSGRASRGARPQDITGTPREHGMRGTGRGERPLRGGRKEEGGEGKGGSGAGKSRGRADP